MRDLALFALGMNAGALAVFVAIAHRWSIRHAITLFRELWRWMEERR